MNAKHFVKATLIALLTSVSFTLSHGTAQAISCGDTLGPGGSYTLSTDLNCSNDFALYVIGPVTVDLNGHALRCTDFAGGVEVSGTSAQVFNGSIIGCEPGVEAIGSTHQFSFLVVQGYVAAGFDIESTDSYYGHNLVTTSRAAHPDAIGFFVIGTGNTLSQNSAAGNEAGFWDGGTKSTYIANFARGNYFGFFARGLKTSKQSLLKKNTATKNAVGIGWYGSTARMTKNTVTKNTIVGLGLFADGKSLVSGNTVKENLGDLYDTTPGCGSNVWQSNSFTIANQPCIH
jgi:copper-binding protein NosD